MLTRHAPRTAASLAALIVIGGGISPARGGDFLFHKHSGWVYTAPQPVTLTTVPQSTSMIAVAPQVTTSAFVMPQATATSFVMPQATATAFVGTPATTTASTMVLTPVATKHHHHGIQWVAMPQLATVAMTTPTTLATTTPATGTTRAVTAPSLTGSPAVTQLKASGTQSFVTSNGQVFTAPVLQPHPDAFAFPNLANLFGSDARGLENFEGKLLGFMAGQQAGVSTGSTTADAARNAILDFGRDTLKSLIPGGSVLLDPNVDNDLQTLVQSLIRKNAPGLATTTTTTTAPPTTTTRPPTSAPVTVTPPAPVPVTSGPPPAAGTTTPTQGLTIPARIDIWFHIDNSPPPK
jgi:hypothetical protein